MKALWTLGFAAVAAVVACSSNGDDAATSADEQALVRTTAVSRAMEWVNAKLQYCQAPRGGSNWPQDTACSEFCSRESNGAWNPYRSDCSGLVSWAWQLAAPGRDTEEFAPADNSISHVIAASDLQPGDALNYPADHIILFKSWITKGQSAWLIEEPGCSGTVHYAHEFVGNLSINGSNVSVGGYSETFTSIRYDGITPPVCKPAPPPPPAPKGCGGIQQGEGLGEGSGIQSCDGRFTLDMQTDGNLVIYWKNHGALWSTHATRGHNLRMTQDGNLELNDTCGVTIWSSETTGHTLAHADMQSDGNLVVYGGDGTALWSSGTGGH